MVDAFLTYIAEERTKILKQKQRLEDKLVELDTSEKHYRASGAYRPEAPSDQKTKHFTFFAQATPEQENALAEGRAKNEATIKERVLMLLDLIGPLTSGQILDALQKDTMPHLQRTSLSPQLSRLKADGKIDLVNGVWVRVEPASEGVSPPSEP